MEHTATAETERSMRLGFGMCVVWEYVRTLGWLSRPVVIGMGLVKDSFCSDITIMVLSKVELVKIAPPFQLVEKNY